MKVIVITACDNDTELDKWNKLWSLKMNACIYNRCIPEYEELLIVLFQKDITVYILFIMD